MNIYAAFQIHKCPDIHYGSRHVRWQATFDSDTVGRQILSPELWSYFTLNFYKRILNNLQAGFQLRFYLMLQN